MSTTQPIPEGDNTQDKGNRKKKLIRVRFDLKQAIKLNPYSRILLKTDNLRAAKFSYPSWKK
jgi:hypothetical protein